MSTIWIRKFIIILYTDVVHKNLLHAIRISVKKLFRQYLFPVVISWLVDVTVRAVVVSSNTNNGRISHLPSLRRIYNPLRPGDSYMRHWTGSSSVHVMACRSFGMWRLIVNSTLRKVSQWNFYRNWNIFIEEFVFENVVCNRVLRRVLVYTLRSYYCLISWMFLLYSVSQTAWSRVSIRDNINIFLSRKSMQI